MEKVNTKIMDGNFMKYESVHASYILALCPLGLGFFWFLCIYYNYVTYLLDPITGVELKTLTKKYWRKNTFICILGGTFWLGGRHIIVKVCQNTVQFVGLVAGTWLGPCFSAWIENFLLWFCVIHVWELQNSYFDFVHYFVSHASLYWLFHRISLNKYVFS